MGQLKNRIGETYGYLTVIERGKTKIHPSGSPSIQWVCKCKCGNVISVDVNNLRMGHTQSCGCLSKTHPNATKHNLYHRYKRLYNIWTNMKQRCTNPNNSDFKNYGGRGIEVCNEWRDSFENFCLWALDNGYGSDLTIDRIDNNGNYEPSNCRWVTMLIQRHNQRRLNDCESLMREWEAST